MINKILGDELYEKICSFRYIEFRVVICGFWFNVLFCWWDDNRKMIKLECFILSENFSSNVDFEIFESINNNIFKENYFLIKGESLKTHIIFLDEDKKSLVNNRKVQKYYNENDVSVFPLVLLNDEIISRGRFLSSDELADILDIGLSTQQNPELENE